MPSVLIYLEQTSKRAFACALDWPGWCRGGRDEAEAVAALVTYGPRYAQAVAESGVPFQPPSDPSELDIVERLPGNAGTDFGMPAISPESDQRPLSADELERLIALLRAAWLALDEAARAHAHAELRKGPRGGGRDADKIVAHVLEADRAYVQGLGGSDNALRDVHGEELEVMRKAALDTLRARQEGLEPTPGPRRKSPFWTPRYFIRRSAWHSLDHAWEIEDRALP